MFYLAFCTKLFLCVHEYLGVLKLIYECCVKFIGWRSEYIFRTDFIDFINCVNCFYKSDAFINLVEIVRTCWTVNFMAKLRHSGYKILVTLNAHLFWEMAVINDYCFNLNFDKLLISSISQSLYFIWITSYVCFVENFNWEEDNCNYWTFYHNLFVLNFWVTFFNWSDLISIWYRIMFLLF